MDFENVKVLLTENHHSPEFDEFFRMTSRDAFHESAVLSALSSKWYSILIVDGAMAFHNSFVLRAIDGKDVFDIEPLMGYAGPLTTTTDRNFVRHALEIYSKMCRELKIVAELVRFDPVLNNQIAFSQQDAIRIMAAKQVVVLDCWADEVEQLKQFSRACRRDVRLGLRRREFRRLESSAEIHQFRVLYEASIKRLKMGSQRLFSDQLYRKAANSDLLCAYGVYDGDRLVSTSLVIHHPTCSHHMLAANAEDYPPGASELLVYGIARESAKRGIRRLMLGGGITSTPADALLRFKQKFAKGSVDFYIGKLIHDRTRYLSLCDEAVAAEPHLASSSFFLKYRYAKNEQKHVRDT